MANRRVGLWLIGAFGSVGSTVALGLASLARKLSPPTGLVTALPVCDRLDLDDPGAFVVGGHDIRRTDFRETVLGLNERSHIFSARQIEACTPELTAWTANIRPGTILQSNETIRAMAELPEAQKARSPREAIDRVQTDLKAFQAKHRLDQVVVINVASTEPPFELSDEHRRLEALETALDRANPPGLPASGIYAYAALDLALPYVNFTPSLGTSCPALDELARRRGVPHGGKDGKTGETLLKSVLAPMFAARNLRVLSWIGHNILGGGDGRVLNDPANKASKVKSKDAALGSILGYRPQSLVSIEYVESLDDWKTAWDHIHFEGFLGTKMAMQFTWEGCDSVLAAPLVIDLARLALLAQRRGETGVMAHLACFFKSPIGTDEHDFARQWAAFEAYAGRAGAAK
jgi:myo-inositol-1-phosphate synthase